MTASTVEVIVVQTALLAALQFAPSLLTDFYARKVCHSVSGLLMMQLDPRDGLARWYVYAVVVVSLSLTWVDALPCLRFSRKKRDTGISVYLCIVAIWFYLEMPIAIMAPMFFADPSGAIVGKFCSKHFGRLNRAWYQEKTVAGSLAVFTITHATIGYSVTSSQRLLLAALATVGEALGGEFDNLVLAAVVFLGWVAFA